MPWTDVPSLEHEKFHRRNDDPYWNESSFVSFRIPERNLMGLIWFYFRPNQNSAVGGPVFWDFEVGSISDCLHFAYDQHLPIPHDAEMFDFTLSNGLSVRTVNPQKSLRLTYSGPECRFDLVFDASHEPCYVGLEKDKDNPGLADWVVKIDEPEITTGHYDHFGRINGQLEIRGEAIDVRNAAALRDRSWGPRRMVSTQNRLRGAYTYAMSPDDNGFLAFSSSELPLEDDPIIGTTERVTAGYYVKDGELGRLVSGTRQCERSPDGRPVRERIEAVDDRGRKLVAEGEISSLLEWPGLFGNTLVYWALQRWSFDGYQDAPGEVQDHMLFRHHRRLQGTPTH